MPVEKTLRVVIDTNLLISSAIVSNSLPDKLIRSWLKKTFILLISPEQIEEIRDVSQRGKLKHLPLFTKRMTELLENIEFIAQSVEPLPEKDLPLHGRDPEDDFLIASALGGDADYLVTGDEDLLILKANPKLGRLKIVTVRQFLKLFE